MMANTCKTLWVAIAEDTMQLMMVDDACDWSHGNGGAMAMATTGSADFGGAP